MLMTQRERFLAFANFDPVDRVPRYASFVDSLQKKLTAHFGKSPYEHFDMDRTHGAGLRPPEGFRFPDYSVYHPGKVHGKDGFYIDGNGCGHQEHAFYHFTEYISPLRNASSFEDIKSYPFVSNEGWLDDKMKQAGDEAKRMGKPAALFVGHMYENAWQVRGYEQFLEDLLTQREWAEYILDRFYENNLRTATAAARAGYDAIYIGDDVANQNTMMFSRKLWQEVMKPRWAKVISAARAIKPDIHVWYHSDGNVTEIIDDIQCHPTGVII